ncbi:hypothetical protein L2E82_12596 [Cichorium intybus]|uniref:Uncharacterized protein n=1 Tax=Cichorium intybus TaxID=13427 RepID=A0ACB9GHI8_CICIN|nr:hypothetical protein L2E82_12596 [Cichorium intybus]
MLISSTTNAKLHERSYKSRIQKFIYTHLLRLPGTSAPSTIGNSLQDRTRGPLSLAVSGIPRNCTYVGMDDDVFALLQHNTHLYLPNVINLSKCVSGNDMAEEGVDQELLAEAENVALLQAANFNGHKWSICAALDIYTVHLCLLCVQVGWTICATRGRLRAWFA